MKFKLILAFLLLLALTAFAQGDSDKEIAAKAEFLINLSQHAEWTAGGGPNDSGPVVICVVGSSPLVPQLKELAAREASKGQKYEIKEVAISDDLSGCHILFLPIHELAQLAKVLKKVNGTSLLTVSDAKDFARYGVMVNFFKEEGKSKVKAEVNTMVIQEAGIKLSDKLMKQVVTI